MYVPDEKYFSVCALLIGYDLACEGGALFGFHEWLVMKLDWGDNLVWEVLALQAVFPEIQDHTDPLLLADKGKNRKAIDGLFDLLDEFDREMSTHDGIFRLIAEYYSKHQRSR